jgi:hypothetical protein
MGVFWSLIKAVLKEIGGFSCRVAIFLAKVAAKITLGVVFSVLKKILNVTIRVVLFLLGRLVEGLEKVV